MGIDITKLSSAEKKEIADQIKQEQKEARKKRKETIETFKELSAEFVTENVDSLLHHKDITEFLISDLFKKYKGIQELKKEVYGEKNQDSHTSTLPDGSASITIGTNVVIKFDGTESAGVEKIMNYLGTLSSDDEKSKKLEKITKTFLKPNPKTKMLNPAKIIELNKLRSDFEDDQFDEGLDIIIDAQIRTQTGMYVSGWKYVNIENRRKKIEFRFSV